MAGSTRLVDLVQARIDDFLDQQAAHVAKISPDLTLLTDAADDLLASGKRFRALFCYWGWQSVSGLVGDDLGADTTTPDAMEAVLGVAASLELFHAAALVHDDIMDNSDLRRGRPSLHRHFETVHRQNNWQGSPQEHGEATALLLGDLLLGWSDELFEAGLSACPDEKARVASRAEFTRMRTDVMLGQYLDMLDEHSWHTRPDAELLPRAHRVIVYKSAKYTVEAPLALGASLANGSLAQLSALREFGLPLGVAFQLRDDLLGVFGDPSVTGKPAGDDLREGKRTVLITLARQKLTPSASRLVDELLGDPDLDDGQIAMLQSTIRDSGAVDQVERIIARNVDVARAALTEAPLTRAACEQLTTLADTITRRVS